MRRSARGLHETGGRPLIPWLLDRELNQSDNRRYFIVMGGSSSSRRSVFQRHGDNENESSEDNREISEAMNTDSSSEDEEYFQNEEDNPTSADDEDFDTLGPLDPDPQNKRIDPGLHYDLYPSQKSTSFPTFLSQREYHGCHSHSSSNSRMASHLLPNRFEKVPKNSEALSTKIFCSSFDATGNLLITASQDCLIRVYDARNNFKNIQSQIGQDISWSIIDLDVSPDSQRFIYSSWSESIRMGRIDSITGHHEPLTLGSPDSSLGIFSVRFSPNLFEVLAGCSDNCVRIYDLERNMQVLRVRGHENQVNAVSFLDDSPNIIASGGDDDIVRIWDRRTLSNSSRRPKPVGFFCGHFDGITYVDSRKDGRYLISNSKDQTIKLWDMRKPSARRGLTESRVFTLSYHWDYRWQAVPRHIKNNSDRMRGDTSLMTYKGHTVRQTLIRCRFSPVHSTGQRYIYTGSADGGVYLFDVLTGDVVTHLQSHTQVCRDASWHPYFPEIISCSWDGTLSRWTRADEEYAETETLLNNFLYHTIPSTLRRSSRLADQARILASTLSDVVHYIGDAQNE